MFCRLIADSIETIINYPKSDHPKLSFSLCVYIFTNIYLYIHIFIYIYVYYKYIYICMRQGIAFFFNKRSGSTVYCGLEEKVPVNGID